VKNTKSLQELLELSADLFNNEKHQDVDIVYAAEDGFIFFEDNRARVHCRRIPGLKFHTITRTQAFQAVPLTDEWENVTVNVNSEDVQTVNGTLALHIAPVVTKEADQDPEAEAKELEALKVQYEELYGKAAHHNVGAERLKVLIAEKLTEGTKTEESQNQPE
jgi:hypothetical protein